MGGWSTNHPLLTRESTTPAHKHTQLMLEKGGGQEHCLAKVTEADANADYRGASLLHFAVLNEQPEMLTLLCPYMKESVCVVCV